MNPKVIDRPAPELKGSVRPAWPWLAVPALLMLIWSLVVPIYEAPDEPGHWEYARFIHEQQALPDRLSESGEAHQPPLYYLLLAPLAWPSEVPAVTVFVDATGKWVVPLSPRYYLSVQEDWLAYGPLRLARLVSIFCSCLTLALTWLLGWESSGRRATGMLAAGLTALLPQFSFRGMNISNDALLMLLAALATYGMVRLSRRGFSWRAGILCAAAIGLAFLTKVTAVFLVLPFTLVLLTGAGSLGTRARRLSVLAAGLLIVLPWLVRNQVLFGDPLAGEAAYTTFSARVFPKDWYDPYFFRDFPNTVSRSFVGIFGWMNVLLPEPVYLIYAGIGLAGASGALLRFTRRVVERRSLLVLLLTVLGNLAVVYYLNLSITEPQGRFLLPSLPALAVLLTLGLESLPHWSSRAQAGLLAGLLLLNLYGLFFVVLPVYWPPPMTRVSEATVELMPAAVMDLAPAAGTDGWWVTGKAPAFLVPLPSPAADFAFLQFRLSGVGGSGVLTGVVQLELEGGAAAPPQVPFSWRAGGAEQLVTVPLLQHPAWRGRVTALLIEPFGGTEQPPAGASLRIAGLTLRGRLDR